MNAWSGNRVLNDRGLQSRGTIDCVPALVAVRTLLASFRMQASLEHDFCERPMTENFNLASPPGFRGLDPHLPLQQYQRKLPHWRQAGATYFVTFRLADAIPQIKLKALQRWRALWERGLAVGTVQEDWETLAQKISRKTEAWLDRGYGSCIFRDRQLAEMVGRSLVFFQNERCNTPCYTILPNHVHAVMHPLPGFALEHVLDRIKGFTSLTVNRMLGRRGTLWEPESFDRIIRDEEHLYRVIQYIGNNALRAGLPPELWVRWVDPEWEQCGWGFR